MKLTITDYPFGTRPQVPLPSPAFLEHLGQAGIRRLVSDHYDALVRSPIAGLFPSEPVALARAKQNAADFFIQVCGGPATYSQRRGQPRMAMRHAPFRITPEARRAWLACYRPLLERLEAPAEAVVSFWRYLDGFSMWMVNTPSEQPEDLSGRGIRIV